MPYITANSMDAICERNQQSPFFPKFLCVSVPFVTYHVMKEESFYYMIGCTFPLKSKILCGSSISMTILAAFSLPSIVSPYLQKTCRMNQWSSDIVAQLFTPVFMQVFTTPLIILTYHYVRVINDRSFSHPDISSLFRRFFI